MPADSPHMNELRRRVQADPASIAFAQLAEECRRTGANDEAVTICRAGLERYPSYLSARVTLGRALIELGDLDAAEVELGRVVTDVPTNLAAIRGLAEIFQRRGRMTEALEYYRRALDLARHDPDLEDTVERISQVVAPAPAPPPSFHVPVEELFDFDSLIRQLGEINVPEVPQVPEVRQVPQVPQVPGVLQVPDVLAPSVLESVELEDDDTDSLAVMERELRELEEQRARDELAARELLAIRRRDAGVAALELWLAAVMADRHRHGA